MRTLRTIRPAAPAAWRAVLAARAPGLHVGVDIAKGPEDESFHVIAGSSF